MQLICNGKTIVMVTVNSAEVSKTCLHQNLVFASNVLLIETPFFFVFFLRLTTKLTLQRYAPVKIFWKQI